MIATVVVALLVIGNAYCRSLPFEESLSEINVELLNEESKIQTRNTRQSGASGKKSIILGFLIHAKCSFNKIVSEYIFHPNIPDTSNNPSLYPQQQPRKQATQQKQANKFIPIIFAK